MRNRVIFLSIVAAMGVISSTLCAPALPFIADHFSAHFSYIQFTISFFLIGNAFGQLVSGPLSDRIGQKLVLMGGLFFYVIASSGCALADNMGVLLCARFVQGMGSSVGPVLARAIASSSFSLDRSAQVQSYGALGVGLASMVAILSSGRLTLVSWRGNFWLAAALGLILLVWAGWALKTFSSPLNHKSSIRKMFSQMWGVLKHPGFLGSTLPHAMTYGLMYGYIGLFPFILKELFQEHSPMQVGIYSAYMIAFYMLGTFLAARLVLRCTATKMIFWGIALQLVSGIALVFSASLFFFLAALFLFNISIGIILPLTSAKALASFSGQAVGFASSSLGLSYRFIGSFLSMGICQLPLLGGKNLGFSICLLSLISLVVFWKLAKFAINLYNAPKPEGTL